MAGRDRRQGAHGAPHRRPAARRGGLHGARRHSRLPHRRRRARRADPALLDGSSLRVRCRDPRPRHAPPAGPPGPRADPPGDRRRPPARLSAPPGHRVPARRRAARRPRGRLGPSPGRCRAPARGGGIRGGRPVGDGRGPAAARGDAQAGRRRDRHPHAPDAHGRGAPRGARDPRALPRRRRPAPVAVRRARLRDGPARDERGGRRLPAQGPGARTSSSSAPPCAAWPTAARRSTLPS